MTLLWLIIGACIITALVLVLALCKVSGHYSEQECEDYLNAREDEDSSGLRVTLNHVDEFAENIARGRE